MGFQLFQKSLFFDDFHEAIWGGFSMITFERVERFAPRKLRSECLTRAHRRAKYRQDRPAHS